MRPEDCVGQTGRTVSEVAATGRIEVASETFDAMTFGPPIPAGETVEVTGWQLAEGERRVLSVRVPRPEGQVASGLRPRTTEERLAELERVCRRIWRPGNPVGGFGWLLLTFGQVVSVISCVVTPIYAAVQLAQVAAIREKAPTAPDPSVWIILGGMLLFLYSAAMAVVFNRVKQLPPLD